LLQQVLLLIKVTTLPDMGILRWLQADHQQFVHQNEGV